MPTDQGKRFSLPVLAPALADAATSTPTRDVSSNRSWATVGLFLLVRLSRFEQWRQPVTAYAAAPLDGKRSTPRPARPLMRRIGCRDIMKITSHDTVRHDLLELVAALDRRVPSLEREGECAIARDAQGLRRAALKRIAELERTLPPPGLNSAGRDMA